MNGFIAYSESRRGSANAIRVNALCSISAAAKVSLPDRFFPIMPMSSPLVCGIQYSLDEFGVVMQDLLDPAEGLPTGCRCNGQGAGCFGHCGACQHSA